MQGRTAALTGAVLFQEGVPGSLRLLCGLHGHPQRADALDRLPHQRPRRQPRRNVRKESRDSIANLEKKSEKAVQTLVTGLRPFRTSVTAVATALFSFTLGLGDGVRNGWQTIIRSKSAISWSISGDCHVV